MTDIAHSAPGTEAPKNDSSAALWLGGLVIGAGFLASLVFHMALLGAVVLSDAKLLETPSEKPIMVDIVSADDAGTPPAPEQTPRDQPQPLQIPDSTPTEQRQAAQAPTQHAPAAPSSSRNQPAPPDTKAQQPGVDAAAAARLAELFHLSETDQKSAGLDPAPADTGANLTADEVERFKTHLKTCWTAPEGAAANRNVRAVIRISLRPNGQLASNPALLAATASTYGPVLVKSAMAALRQCQPYNFLPADRYKEWKFLDLNFTADDVAGVKPGLTPPKAPG